MTYRLYIAGSIGNLDRARAAIIQATQAGWTITRDWTLDPVQARMKEREPSTPGRTLPQGWLQAVQECDVFLYLGTAIPTRGKDRELGAAMMLKTMGHRKRIILSLRQDQEWLAMSPTAWDELCEVYPDDRTALTALGNPGPAPWEPLYGPPGLWIGRQLTNGQWEVRQVGVAQLAYLLGESSFRGFGFLRFAPDVTPALERASVERTGWIQVREVTPGLCLVHLGDGTCYTERSKSLWAVFVPWWQALELHDPVAQELLRRSYQFIAAGKREGDPDRWAVEQELAALQGRAAWELQRPVTDADRKALLKTSQPGDPADETVPSPSTFVFAGASVGRWSSRTGTIQQFSRPIDGDRTWLVVGEIPGKEAPLGLPDFGRVSEEPWQPTYQDWLTERFNAVARADERDVYARRVRELEAELALPTDLPFTPATTLLPAADEPCKTCGEKADVKRVDGGTVHCRTCRGTWWTNPRPIQSSEIVPLLQAELGNALVPLRLRVKRIESQGIISANEAANLVEHVQVVISRLWAVTEQIESASMRRIGCLCHDEYVCPVCQAADASVDAQD